MQGIKKETRGPETFVQPQLSILGIACDARWSKLLFPLSCGGIVRMIQLNIFMIKLMDHIYFQRSITVD